MEKTVIEGGGAFALFGETRSRRARVEGTLRRLLRCIASREFTRTSPATWYTATPPAEAAIRHLSAAGSFAGTTSFIALGSPMGPAGTAFAAGAGSSPTDCRACDAGKFAAQGDPLGCQPCATRSRARAASGVIGNELFIAGGRGVGGRDDIVGGRER